MNKIIGLFIPKNNFLIAPTVLDGKIQRGCKSSLSSCELVKYENGCFFSLFIGALARDVVQC
jgi:hypothetical protein